MMILFFLFGKNTFAQTDCGLSLDNVSNVTFNWDGNSQTFTGNITLRRTNTGGNCKNFEIGFSTGLAGNYARRATSLNSNYISYNLYKDNQANAPLKALDTNPNKGEFIAIKFKKKTDVVESVTFEARFLMPNDNRYFLSKGLYKDIVEIRVESKGGNVLSITKNIEISLDIPAEINISLISPGGTFDSGTKAYTLDFGTISAGDVRNVDLKVKSNAGYSLSIESLYNGALKNTLNSDKISYNLSVNGIPKTFNGPSVPLPLGSAPGVTPESGVNFGLGFVIGSPAGKSSGEYKDFITVTASSTD